MRVIVFTSDKYVSLIKGFAHLFNKHWGEDQQVSVLGFDPPDFDLPANFEFISAGKQTDFKPKAFCEPFRPILESFDDEVFTIFIEDFFLISSVDKVKLSKAVNLLESNKASKVDLFLGGDYQFASSDHFDDDFNVYPQNMEYRFPACGHIVRKDYYLKYFDQETIWDLEVKNIERSKNDGHNLLVPKTPIAPWINVIVKGKWNQKHAEQMHFSATKRNFGWNVYQKLDDEEYEIFLSYKDWSPG